MINPTTFARIERDVYLTPYSVAMAAVLILAKLIPTPQRVLDTGAGPGVWARALRDVYGNGAVIDAVEVRNISPSPLYDSWHYADFLPRAAYPLMGKSTSPLANTILLRNSKAHLPIGKKGYGNNTYKQGETFHEITTLSNSYDSATPPVFPPDPGVHDKLPAPFFPEHSYDLIIGNPPYAQAEPFIRRALGIEHPGATDETGVPLLREGGHLCYLLEHNFASGHRRHKGLFEQAQYKEVWVATRRINWVLPEDSPLRKGGGRMVHSCYFWQKGYKGGVATQRRLSWEGVGG